MYIIEINDKTSRFIVPNMAKVSPPSLPKLPTDILISYCKLLIIYFFILKLLCLKSFCVLVKNGSRRYCTKIKLG